MTFNNFLISLSVFFASALNDVFWTKWTTSANNKKAFKTAFYSVFILLSSGFSITQYVENKWFLIPAVLGAFMGTYMTIKLENK